MGEIKAPGHPRRGSRGRLRRTFCVRRKAADGSATRISPIFSAPYQLALRTPGISPHSASSRKQIRHSPN
jgi:hypothetical protein